MDKHNVRSSEIKDALLNYPHFLRAKGRRYMAISFSNRFLTIIFELIKDTAKIITAYPSSDAQRKLYKHKKQL